MGISKQNPKEIGDATQDPDPNKKCLEFWSSGVDAIKQLLVLILDRSSPDVAFGSGARESATFDDDDVFGRGNALVDIAARVELRHSPNNFLLQLLAVHGALLRSLDKQGGGGSTVSDRNALGNEINTCSADAVIDRPEMTNSDERLQTTRLGLC